MRMFNRVLEIHTRALRPWNYFRVHTHDFYRHIVWGRLSIVIGQPHLEPVTVCAHCYEELGHLSWQDERVSHCSNCQITEGDTTEITMEEYEARHG